MYERGQLDRVAAIRRLQHLGLSLKEVARAIVAGGPAGGGNPVERLQPVIERQIELTDARMQQLRAELDGLRDARRRLLEMCRGCAHVLSRAGCDPCPRDGMPLPSVLRALLD